ncbi:MAG: saccharopine dehydrogenase C-terminal domain-containing protein, partial [Bacteroidota bacterium]
MRKILVLGAGKSSWHLINYLLSNAQEQNWHVTVADASVELAKSKTQNHSASNAIAFNINDESQRKSEISKADIVISLLPPSLHAIAAVECLSEGKNLVTASYVSEQMNALNNDVKNKNLIFLNECGLDPGIDHMSAMQIIHVLQAKGAEIISFKSYTGGLISPGSNNNPWGYKFTWNPKNVILAGQGTALYRQNRNNKFTPYHRLFSQIEKINISGTGQFEGYANRNSNAYIETYNLQNISSDSPEALADNQNSQTSQDIQNENIEQYVENVQNGKQNVSNLMYFKNEPEIKKDGKINEIIKSGQHLLVQVAK